MPRQIADETIIRRTPSALWRPFDQETAVILPTASAVRVLNEVGARVWQLADGRTFGEIINTLMNEYDVERTQLQLDAEAFLSELYNRGLLEDPAEK
ncbi:MAG: PqqD family protein [Pseudomonadota bacterium]